jgi:hypothetical protein
MTKGEAKMLREELGRPTTKIITQRANLTSIYGGKTYEIWI